MNSSSWKKKRPRVAKPRSYRFNLAEVPSCPVELSSGKGLSTVKSIGLEHFLLHAELPKLNAKLCTSFISSYNAKAGFGVVKGQKIEITAEAVAEVTGLPMGTSNGQEAQLILAKEELLHRFVPSTAKRSWHGYDLEQLIKHSAATGDDEEVEEDEDTLILVAIGRRMMQKMVCRTRFVQYANVGVLVGIETAIKNSVEMAWAEFMARSMKKALANTKRRPSSFFVFGEWLTGLLEHALAPLSAASNSERKNFFDYQQELQRRLGSSSPVIDPKNVIAVMGDEMERMKAEMRNVLDFLESHLVSWKGKTEEQQRERLGLMTELAEERKARKEAEERQREMEGLMTELAEERKARKEAEAWVEESQMELEDMIEDLACRRDDLELENLRLREELELREDGEMSTAVSF